MNPEHEIIVKLKDFKDEDETKKPDIPIEAIKLKYKNLDELYDALDSAGFYLPTKNSKIMSQEFLYKCLQREIFVITKSILKKIPVSLNWPEERPKKKLLVDELKNYFLNNNINFG